MAGKQVCHTVRPKFSIHRTVLKKLGFDEGFIACSYSLHKMQLDVLKGTFNQICRISFFAGFKSFWETKLQNKN